MIGEGFGEWLKPSLGKEGWVVVKNLLVLFEKDKKKILFSSSFFVILHAHCKIIKSNK